MNRLEWQGVYDILDILLHNFAILPGLRDEEGRDLLIFPVPNKDVTPTYDEISIVCNYLITIPKRSVLNRGLVVLIDTYDADSERLSDIFMFLCQLQATVPGCIVVIHLISPLENEKEVLLHFRNVNPYLGIEVLCTSIENLVNVIPASSLPTSLGGQVCYDNDSWIKFRCNVEPFLCDCKSMGKRLEDLVRPLLDVESVLAETCDVELVTEKYRNLAAQTMKNLHIQSLLNEGNILIERYTEAAADFPDMQDTLSSISDALSHLGSLQDSVHNLAEKGQNKAKSMAAYTKFKRNSDHLSKEIRQLKSQIADLNDVGLYDVSTVQSKQAMLQKYQLTLQDLESSVNRCIDEGLNIDDISRLKDAEKEIKVLQSDMKTLKLEEKQKREKLDEIFEFHKLVEECMSWFFSGIQRFTAQPVQRCNTLEGICELEVELDKHLSRCPIDGYGTLDTLGTTIGTKAVISRIKMIKTKFNLFEKIVTERQEYLRKLKGVVLNDSRNNNEVVDMGTLTGLSAAPRKGNATLSAGGTQFDPKDIFGCIRNSAAQTDMACVCSSDRLKHMSARITAVETRLGIPDRSNKLPDSSGVLERLAHILTRIGIIESYLKRLRFSSVYDTFYDHPKLSTKTCSELMLDMTPVQDTSRTSSTRTAPHSGTTPNSYYSKKSDLAMSSLASPRGSDNRTRSVTSPRNDTLSPRVTSPGNSNNMSPNMVSPRNNIKSPNLTSPRSYHRDPSYSSPIVTRDCSSPITRDISARQEPIQADSDSSLKIQPDDSAATPHGGSSTIPDSSPNVSSRGAFSSNNMSPESLPGSEALLNQSDDPLSNNSTSCRLSSQYTSTIPRSPSPNDDEIVRDKLAEIETLLLDIEHQIHHDLKVHNGTQTGEESVAPTSSDSSSQTESESETESVSTQYETESVSSATQCEKSAFSGRGVQVTPNAAHVSTDTEIVLSSSSSQSDLTDIKNQQSQTPVKALRHTSSQYVGNSTSAGVQSNNPGVETGVQMCPIHCDVGVQNSRECAQRSAQTDILARTSSESQVDSESADSSSQTQMIGLFPASVQTDVQHFAAGSTQTEVDSQEVGLTVLPESADRGSTADIKSSNHKEVSALIKPKNHKGVSAIVQMKTASTAAKITQLFHKTVNTTPKFYSPAQVQVSCSMAHATVDTTTDFWSESKTTDTDNLVYCHEESSQTSLFETYYSDSQCQTEECKTLMSGHVSQSILHKEVQTGEDDDEQGSRQPVRGSRSMPRGGRGSRVTEPHMTFKDVSYIKNKTHDLRVAKIQKSKEEEEQKAAKERRVAAKRSSKSREDVVKRSSSSRDDLRSITHEEELDSMVCTCPVYSAEDGSVAGVGEVHLAFPDTTLTYSVKIEDGDVEEETESEEEEGDNEEGDGEGGGESPKLPRMKLGKSSFKFPTEEVPSPITESPGHHKYTIQESLPKKLQFVIQEMLETEERYVDDLNHVVEGYMEPMIHNPDPNISGLAENIFQYFGQIHSFHSNTFMSSIIAAGTSDNPLKDIATTFVSHEQELAVYLSFMVHERRAHAIIQQHHSGLISELEASLDDKLGLSANLLKPTQRMVKYKQFLDVIVDKCQDTGCVEDVSDAHTMVTNILNTSNDLCHLQALQLPLDISPDTTGELLKQADFHVVVNNKQKRLRRVFLFENYIVFSKEFPGSEDEELRYRSKHVVGLHEIGLTPYTPEEPNKCHVWTGETSFTMFSVAEQAEDWSRSISTILWGQLKQLKRDRDMSRLQKKSRGVVRVRVRGAKRK